MALGCALPASGRSARLWVDIDVAAVESSVDAGNVPVFFNRCGQIDELGRKSCAAADACYVRIPHACITLMRIAHTNPWPHACITLMRIARTSPWAAHHRSQANL